MAFVVAPVVIGAGVAIYGQKQQEKAQKSALNDQRNASIQSANVLAGAGRAAEKDIIRANNQAGATSSRGALDAAKALEPFADYEAMQRAQDEIIGNLGLSGPIADSLRQASTSYIQSRPEFQNDNIMQGQVERQGDLAVGEAGQGFRQRMLSAGEQGLAAVNDVANIEQAGINRLADLAGNTGAARSSLLVGQTGDLANLSTSANEARLLSGVVGQNSQSDQFETLGNLAGQLYDPKGEAGKTIRSALNANQTNGFGSSGWQGTGGI